MPRIGFEDNFIGRILDMNVHSDMAEVEGRTPMLLWTWKVRGNGDIGLRGSPNRFRNS